MLRVTSLLALAALLGCTSSAKPLAVAEPAPPAQPTPAAPSQPTQPPEPQPQPDPPRDPNDCNPFVAPVVRTGGSLTVHAPPKKSTRTFLGRLRSHTDGALSATSKRVWTGPQVPGFVPLTEGTMELFLLDHQPDGSFLAFYRDPYGAGSCTLGDHRNCDYAATLFAHCGEVRWSIALSDLLSRPDRLEIQDIRLGDGTLYFNEACQSYSKEAKGKCSALVAVDPDTTQVLWRTPNLVSNGRFFIADDYIVSGYGFTAEKDKLRVVRRTDGKIMQVIKLPKNPEDIRLLEPGVIQVIVYPGTTVIPFRMEGWDTDTPKLVRLGGDAPAKKRTRKRMPPPSR